MTSLLAPLVVTPRVVGASLLSLLGGSQEVVETERILFLLLLELHWSVPTRSAIRASELAIRNELAGFDDLVEVVAVDVLVDVLAWAVQRVANLLVLTPGLVVDVVRLIIASVEATIHALKQ